MTGAAPATTSSTATKTVALVGNPNTGKTTLFNALTGHRAKVANYPGVTVEKRSGPLRELPGVEVLDLPGTYSLAARSPDELVAVDVLLGRRDDTPRPDAAIVVADASNLERNLYLATQVLEAGLPVVVALTMTDVARARGHAIDLERLAKGLGVPVVPLVAHKGEGLPALVGAVAKALADGVPSKRIVGFPAAFELEVEALDAALAASPVGRVPAAERRRILLDVGGAAELRAAERGGPAIGAAIAAARARLAAEGVEVAGLEAPLRYAALGPVVAAAVVVPDDPPPTFSDRLDAVLTHRVAGTLVFAGLMTLVFLSIFAWSAPAMDALDGLFESIKEWIRTGHRLGGGAFESLVADGVIGGVGGILVFLPQILVLSLFLAILEDCGYMARAAFLMDRLLRWCGLSGKSFIPMLSSFACAVPGIMATRTIEHRRDRIATILVAPLMSCSARLPVYALVVGAFLPGATLGQRALVFAAAYFLGIVVAIPVAFLLKKTLLRGETPPFLMELPPYKRPLARSVLQRVLEQGRAFVTRAGTLILATSVVIWALTWFPRDPAIAAEQDRAVAAAQATVDAAKAAGRTGADLEAVEKAASEAQAAAERHAKGRYMRESLLGRAGRVVEPVFAPIGWDWKVSVAVLASFPAREVVVGVLGVLYDLDGEDAESDALRSQIQAATWDHGPREGQKVFDLGAALALLVFFALCLQCVSTLAVMRKETGGWRWPAFAFGYMTALAYVGALVTAVVTRAVVG
ncbi:MAG: ferrous iron transport protein B [Planctomycetota bacterium]